MLLSTFEAREVRIAKKKTIQIAGFETPALVNYVYCAARAFLALLSYRKLEVLLVSLSPRGARSFKLQEKIYLKSFII